jgi:hypothetical protein
MPLSHTVPKAKAKPNRPKHYKVAAPFFYPVRELRHWDAIAAHNPGMDFSGNLCSSRRGHCLAAPLETSLTADAPRLDGKIGDNEKIFFSCAQQHIFFHCRLFSRISPINGPDCLLTQPLRIGLIR